MPIRSLAENQAHHGTGEQFIEECRSRVTADMLPDVALLNIFDFYLFGARKNAWCILVNVCRKWRNIVFGSPRRLNVRLYCTIRTPVTEMMDIWPPLPIFISDHNGYITSLGGMNNLVAALEHNGRVCGIDLRLPESQEGIVFAAMQQPFPTLTSLRLQTYSTRNKMVPVIPDLFLGGSAPCLQELFLDGIPFPGLPNLLLSATHLVRLELLTIPHSGYFSPEAIVTGISVSTRLETLIIEFESPQSHPDPNSPHPPPLTRTHLPALIDLQFKGVGEYLEDLVARIDAPLVVNLKITFHKLIIDTPQLVQFISRTPKFMTCEEPWGSMCFSESDASFSIPRYPRTSGGVLELKILCKESDRQLSSLMHLCSSSLPQALIPMMEYLYIETPPYNIWEDEDIEDIHWLGLLQPFTALKTLGISAATVVRIAPAFDLVEERGLTEVLPVLETLLLEETIETPFPSAVELKPILRFSAARQLSLRRWGYNFTEEIV